MKKTLLLFAVLAMASCKKELDIQPRQSISSGVALATTADVQNALIGAYTVLATGDLYGTNLVFVPDLYAGNGYLNWTGSFSTYRDIANKSIIATNVNCAATSFTFTPTDLQRNAIVTMVLSIQDSTATETVNLHHEVHVDNTP